MKGLDIGGKDTRFKPGHLGGSAADRLKPIGAERITDDGYLQRKVCADGPAHRRWKAVHILLWESHHGPVPRGHIVVFRNGDQADIRLDNLEMITREENMRRNTRHNLPPELNHAISLRAALVRKINMRSKREKS